MPNPPPRSGYDRDLIVESHKAREHIIKGRRFEIAVLFRSAVSTRRSLALIPQL
jgi:hypothetical protein